MSAIFHRAVWEGLSEVLLSEQRFERHEGVSCGKSSIQRKEGMNAPKIKGQ